MSFRVFPYIFVLSVIICVLHYFIYDFEFYLQLDLSLSLTIFFEKFDTSDQNKCAKYYFLELVIPNCCNDNKFNKLSNEK